MTIQRGRRFQEDFEHRERSRSRLIRAGASETSHLNVAEPARSGDLQTLSRDMPTERALPSAVRATGLGRNQLFPSAKIRRETIAGMQDLNVWNVVFIAN